MHALGMKVLYYSDNRMNFQDGSSIAYISLKSGSKHDHWDGSWHSWKNRRQSEISRRGSVSIMDEIEPHVYRNRKGCPLSADTGNPLSFQVWQQTDGPERLWSPRTGYPNSNLQCCRTVTCRTIATCASPGQLHLNRSI